MKIRNNKKKLEKQLIQLMLIYFEGLSEKKKLRITKYMDKKMGSIVNYYFNLLKRKQRKHHVLPVEKTPVNQNLHANGLNSPTGNLSDPPTITNRQDDAAE